MAYIAYDSDTTHNWGAGSLIPVGGNLLQKALQSQKKNSNFP